MNMADSRPIVAKCRKFSWIVLNLTEFAFFEKRVTHGRTDGRMDGRTDGRMDGRTNGRKISPFYRTSSPIGAAALPAPMKTKEKVEQGKGTADHLIPLGYLFISLFLITLPFPDTHHQLASSTPIFHLRFWKILDVPPHQFIIQTFIADNEAKSRHAWKFFWMM